MNTTPRRTRWLCFHTVDIVNKLLAFGNGQIHNLSFIKETWPDSKFYFQMLVVCIEETTSELRKQLLNSDNL
jgi:hypothetical protein